MRWGAIWGVLLVFALSGVAVAATSSHAINWQTPSHQIVCGLAPKVPGTIIDPGTGAAVNGRFAGLQCSTEGIGAKHHAGPGDPFLQLGRGKTGRARVVYLSDDDLASDAKPTTLPANSTWSRDGITCTVDRDWISCHNSSGHGFTLSPDHLKIH